MLSGFDFNILWIINGLIINTLTNKVNCHLLSNSHSSLENKSISFSAKKMSPLMRKLVLTLSSVLVTLFAEYILCVIFNWERNDTVTLIACIISVMISVLCVVSGILENELVLKIAFFASIVQIVIWVICLFIYSLVKDNNNYKSTHFILSSIAVTAMSAALAIVFFISGALSSLDWCWDAPRFALNFINLLFNFLFLTAKLCFIDILKINICDYSINENFANKTQINFQSLTLIFTKSLLWFDCTVLNAEFIIRVLKSLIEVCVSLNVSLNLIRI